MAIIGALIADPDGHEKIRDQIAAILAAEFLGQQAAAILAAEDPLPYQVDVYRERSNPWDRWVEIDTPRLAPPVVNVWFDSSSYERKGSTVRAQRGDGQFNVDIYAPGVTLETPTGQIAGDLTASETAGFVAGVARRILMSGHYTILGSPFGADQFCFGRWVDSIQVFQPQMETRPAVHVVGARILLNAHFKIDSPQVTGVSLSAIQTTVKRSEDDRIVAEIETPTP